MSPEGWAATTLPGTPRGHSAGSQESSSGFCTDEVEGGLLSRVTHRKP